MSAQHQAFFATQICNTFCMQPFNGGGDLRPLVCFYMLPPHLKKIRKADIVGMKNLATWTNVVAVISQADTLTADEQSSYKQKVLDAAAAHDIPLFGLPTSRDGKSKIFAISCQEERKYGYGTCSASEHIEYNLLSSLLFQTHTVQLQADLEEIFMHFKQERISSVAESMVSVLRSESSGAMGGGHKGALHRMQSLPVLQKKKSSSSDRTSSS
eukprot:Lithocolla_globosa_v1_NODE_4290_length_1470_cov_9.632509.p1 type:complete len:213 gc:universal NODE_4290_length_1470_cov_9.632509:709-71(-)